MDIVFFFSFSPLCTETNRRACFIVCLAARGILLLYRVCHSVKLKGEQRDGNLVFDACCIMLDTHRPGGGGCKIIHMQGARTNLTPDVTNEMQNLSWELHCNSGISLRMELKSIARGQMLQ